MDTISIHNSLHQMASKAWHSVEREALRRPHDKSFAIAAFAGTWIKHLALPVAECLDRIHLLEKTYVELIVHEGDSGGKLYRALCAQASKIFRCFLKCLISPFIATYYAVKTCTGMLQSPLKTAKIEAAGADLDVFVDIVHSKRFAIEHSFVCAAFKQFQSSVEQCDTDADVAELHFLDETYVKEQILDKMQKRKECYGRIVRDNIERAVHYKNEEAMFDYFVNFAHDVETIEEWKDRVLVTITEGDRAITDMDDAEDILFAPPSA